MKGHEALLLCHCHRLDTLFPVTFALRILVLDFGVINIWHWHLITIFMVMFSHLLFFSSYCDTLLAMVALILPP